MVAVISAIASALFLVGILACSINDALFDRYLRPGLEWQGKKSVVNRVLGRDTETFIRIRRIEIALLSAGLMIAGLALLADAAA